ncbi:DivIVA domain-containing protein [Clostridium sp. MSJ-8]|uniref:DivIVA domain-containing protein n=1 Tax=Clostridium sp. MSJ-8 TaxID=2841510 RepID=UPI001C0EB570|nr:DivIVA domain-containing protein [Clostridium sp. MSJ-8]MBU5487555.1 DivIVA domain-containing protein [Clostridium sp. MSJ-8]
MKVTLTPMDINNKEFKKVMRGYNAEEVDDFLDEIIDNYEAIYKENSALKEKLASINEQIEHYQKIESTIQNTLLLAQDAADQAKASSEKEAEMIVKNANETAQKILDKAHNDVLQINDEYEDIKQEFIKFRSRFRNFMTVQLETFEDLEKDFTKNLSIVAQESDISIEPLEDIDEEIGLPEVTEEEETLEDEEVNEEVANEEVTVSDEVEEDAKIDEESIKEIENSITTDEIAEIKNFFAMKDEQHKVK